MDDKDEFVQQVLDEYQLVMSRIFRYFWLFFLVGAAAGAYVAFNTEPSPVPQLPAFFWFMII